MPSPTAWMAVVSEKISKSPAPVGPAPARGVEQAQAAGPVAAEAGALAGGQRGHAVVAARHAGGDLGAGRQRRLHRHLVDPVLEVDLGVAGVVQRIGVLRDRRVPPRLLELAAQPVGQSGRPGRGRAVVLGACHVGQVVEAAHVVDAVVELLGAHARALDVARPLGPAVVVDVVALIDDVHVALGEVVHAVQEALVPGPAPYQRHRARELDRLIGVEVVGHGAVGGDGLAVVAEVDRAVGHGLVHDDPRAVVEDVGDVAQRRQVVLDRLKLANRHRREGGVLAVGGEDPRIVGIAGAKPLGVPHRPQRRRVLGALVSPADL